MSDLEFRALLDLFTYFDSYAPEINRDVIETMLDRESVVRGYQGWTDAVHKHLPISSI